MTNVRLRVAASSLALSLLAAAPAPARAEEHGKPAEKDAPKEGELPPVPTATEHYVHRWLPMPGFVATRLPGADGQDEVKAEPGKMLVVVFLSSWCEPCQQLMPSLQRLEKRYRKLNTDVVYVFAHDTRDDAEGFMKEFGMQAGYLANKELLKTFHEPQLPSVYLGDRHGWLTARYLKVGESELAELDGFLKNLTAY